MIVIQDEMLRDVIARTLHISEEEITEEKLLELKGLSARYAGITSLEGLQYAENLEYLDLCGNSIEILDPIRDLRNIERLNVSKNRLRDLQALHGFRQLKKLDSIKFDDKSLKKAIGDFRADIEDDNEIQFVRANHKVRTGQRSPSDVMNEINRRIDHIKGLFDSALRKTNHQLEMIKQKHDQQLVDIFNILKGTITELENSGVFKQGEYSFKDSVLWKLSFENIDADSFASDIKKSVVDKAKKTREVYNYKKDEWRSSRNPFKKFGSLFMSETKTETYYEDGYYETTDLVRSLDTYLRNLQTESDAMANSFREIMDDGKKKVRDLTNRLLKEIQQFLNDIKKQEERIQSLSNSMEKLQKEIEKSEKTNEWLNELAEKIKGA